MHSEAAVSLDFDRISDLEFGTTVGTEIMYTTEDMSIVFSYMHLERDGLHAYANLYNCNINEDDEPVPLIALSFEDSVFKSDGTFISGQCNNDEYDNLIIWDNDVMFSLLDAHLETGEDGLIIVSDDLELYAEMYVPGT